MPAIEIQGIIKTYWPLLALDRVSLKIEEGEFFGLLGPNGAGKTTLISVMAGLTRADGGYVKIHGHDVVNDFKTARAMLGVVPQELVFDPFFTVRETLQLQSGYFGLTNNRQWIDEVMDSLGLSDKADVNMRFLSGGMKRRVLVAQALIHKPRVIVLDEPTAGVDVELRQSLWALITRLNQQGCTIVLTTHYLEEAQAMCRRAAILKHGTIVALDTMEGLINRVEGTRLNLSLSAGLLPLDLLPMAVEDRPGAHHKYSFRLANWSEVDKVLARIHAGGATVADMSVSKTDLEDVFRQVISGA